MLEALRQEINIKAELLEKLDLQTIYFGGGTPSILLAPEISSLIDEIGKYTSLETLAEITLEANPDDLIIEKLIALKSTRINRLSIGIQSFHDDDLRLMNRAHHARQAKECISMAIDCGFERLSVDLIYGIPGSGMERWAANLEIVSKYPVDHLSCYALTIEPKTVMEHRIRKGLQVAPKDIEAEEQFSYLMQFAQENQFEHYEISNFARAGAIAIHNTSYWQRKPYVGIGPSAHSFDLYKRSWNIANNMKYIHAIEAGTLPEETEILREEDHFNEWIMTGLRTMWGLKQSDLLQFSPKLRNHFDRLWPQLAAESLLINESGRWKLSTEGKLFADKISSDLFYID